MDDENERLPPLPDDKKTKTNEKECQSGEEITRARDEIAAMKKAMTSLKSKYPSKCHSATKRPTKSCF